MVGDGFEPPNSERADLQSAAFSHFATPPDGAESRTWTRNLLITSQLLYQLSYFGTNKWWPVRDSNPCMHAWKACVLNRFTNGPFIFRFATSLFYHLDLFSSRDFFKFFKRNYSIILSTNISFVKYFLKFFVSSFYLPETNFYIIPSLSFLVKPFFLKSFLTHPLLLKRTFI